MQKANAAFKQIFKKVQVFTLSLSDGCLPGLEANKSTQRQLIKVHSAPEDYFSFWKAEGQNNLKPSMAVTVNKLFTVTVQI